MFTLITSFDQISRCTTFANHSSSGNMLSEQERLQALEAARELVSALEKPQITESQRIKACKTAHHVAQSLDKTEDAMFKFAYTVRFAMPLKLSENP